MVGLVKVACDAWFPCEADSKGGPESSKEECSVQISLECSSGVSCAGDGGERPEEWSCDCDA